MRVSFREGVRRWYKVNRKRVRRDLFFMSAVWVAAFIYGYFNHKGIFFE